MNKPVNPLESSQVSTFLSEYWQKKPLLIPQAIENFRSPLTPDELAGVACEDGVNARLIIENTDTHSQKKQSASWALEHGPFNESRFESLPETNWSLLVSDMEQILPEAADIIDRFRFIPDWRIDDLMISYAPGGGSVGPHTDAYDVFLLQIYGQRQWHISTLFDPTLLDNTELSILKNFHARQTWTLNPGDILYLPPNVAHHGIALNDCMTASIGFRAPAVNAMIHDFSDTIASRISDSELYTDPDLQIQEHSAEITAEAINKIENLLRHHLKIENESVQRWLGEYTSDRKTTTTEPPHQALQTFSELEMLLITHTLFQAPESRFLFSRTGNGALLFVDGESYSVPLHIAECICHREIDTSALLANCDDDTKQILLSLYNQGALLCDE